MLEAWPAPAPCATSVDRYRLFIDDLCAGRVQAQQLYDVGVQFDTVTPGDDVSAYGSHGGVHVGDYLAEAQGDHQFANAIMFAATRNESASRLVMPMGDWLLTRNLTEADGLRSNLCFDGVDKYACRIYRTTPGGMFQYVNPGPARLTWKNLTLDFAGMTQNFNSSINITNGTECGVQNCRLLCSFPDATEDGIYHQVLLNGGKNNYVIDSYFRGTQAKLLGTGLSADGVLVARNLFEDCNDYGISCVSGDGAGLFVRNVRIVQNEFRGMHGAGYIYAGADGLSDNPDVSDIWIDDNLCHGSMYTQLAVAGRTGILVSLGGKNQRIHIRRNDVTNDNPTVAAAFVYGIRALVRNGTSTSTEDIELANNTVDLRSNDTRWGIEVMGRNITGLRATENTVHAGSRGMNFDNVSHARLCRNDVYGSTTHACQFSASVNAVSDLSLERNHFETVTNFKAAVVFDLAQGATRVTLDDNRLLSPSFSVIKAGAGSLSFRYRRNSVNAPLHSSAVPIEETGTLLEV